MTVCIKSSSTAIATCGGEMRLPSFIDELPAEEDDFGDDNKVTDNTNEEEAVSFIVNSLIV